MAEADKACCSLPAVTTHNYQPKGTYIELAGLKTCKQSDHHSSNTSNCLTSPLPDVTGSTSSNRGLIAIYDIFGFCPQTFQGADRLAESVKGLLLMPDFFKGKPLPLSLYPPDTDEKKKTAMEFMAGPANVDKNVEKLVEAVKEAKEKYGSVKRWGTYGLCWGGKVCGPPL